MSDKTKVAVINNDYFKLLWFDNKLNIVVRF